MNISLGIPEMLASSALPRRLAYLSAARLLLLTLALALVGTSYLRGVESSSTTLRIGLGLLVISFALAGVYALLLRVGRGLPWLADVQIVLDQLTWTVVAYLTGGASSDSGARTRLASRSSLERTS